MLCLGRPCTAGGRTWPGGEPHAQSLHAPYARRLEAGHHLRPPGASKGGQVRRLGPCGQKWAEKFMG